MDERQAYLNSLKKKIFLAARDGRTSVLKVLLANRETDGILGEILRHRTYEYGHNVSPLIIAIINGHEDIVHLLLNLPETDIEDRGDLYLDKEFIINASPLWCAVVFKRLSLVKLLLQHGADINAPTETNSTPIRPACYNGSFEIVKYLVDHGADVNACNKWGNTCLMIAAYNGHVETVKYLCEKGADVDNKNHKGFTALHAASERDNVEVMEVLLCFGRAGIDMKDDIGFTPIMRAAEFAKCDAVDFFISNNLYTVEEEIQALELLGSRLAIPDIDNLRSFLNYYRRAIVLRNNNRILKPVVGQIAAYGNHTECKTLEDLERIKEDDFLLHMEALAIRERILGPTHKEFIDQLRYMAAVYADKGNLLVSLALVQHAVLSNQSKDIHVDELLEFLTELTIENFEEESSQAFNDVYKVLLLVILELKRSKERQDEINTVERNIRTCLYCIGMCLQCTKDNNEFMLLRSEITELVTLNLRLKDGSSSLHMSVLSRDSGIFLDRLGVVRFPNISVCEELIKCGTDVNSTDKNRDTPLHKASQLSNSCVDAYTQNSIMKTLIRAGAHVDAINADGLTAYQCAQTMVARAVLESWTPSLKCFASRVIIRNRIQYKYTVPYVLESFIELHG